MMSAATSYFTNKTPAPIHINLENATRVAKEVGHRTYQLANLTSDVLTFFSIGCAGTAQDSQKKVYALMEKIAQQFGAPQFVVELGDRFYQNSYYKEDGVLSADAEDFNTFFHDIAGNPDLALISGIVFFMIMGNHEGNRQSWEKALKHIIGGRNDPATLEFHQIIHTFLESPELTLKLLTHHELDLNDLIKYIGQWILPADFYSLIAEKLQIIFLNSNTYIVDYLKLVAAREREEEIDPENQAYWLQKKYAEAKMHGRAVIIAQHHPLASWGKRAIKGDAHLYLSPEQISEMNQLIDEPLKSNDYCKMLMKTFTQQGLDPITFKALLCAHDHNLSYRNSLANENSPLKYSQVCSGGGGGKLQHKAVDTNADDRGCFIQQHGFVKVTIDIKNPTDILFDFFTIDDIHLRFNQLSTRPIHESSGDTELDILRETIASLCDQFLKENPPTQHSWLGALSFWKAADDITKVDQFWHYIHRPNLINMETKEKETLSSFVATVNQFCDTLQDQRPEGSLYAKIKVAIPNQTQECCRVD